jgi:pyrroloquinoline quinone (PQQ) biosynthesis protein C
MKNFDRLTEATRTEQTFLRSAPLIQRALTGDVTRHLYLAFLDQAWHHVRHTVPLLMAAGARLTPRHAWLQKEIVHYLEEELGHDEWILDDIDAAGGDSTATRSSAPSVATDSMVAYAYDTVLRRDAAAFFGMVFVLEGTSVALALSVAEALQRSLALPDRAFTYLRSHGKLDQAHIGHLASIIDRLDASRDLPGVIACARTMFWLYGNVFRGLESSAPSTERAGSQEVAACN